MASDGGAGDVDEGWRSNARSLPNSTPLGAPVQTQLQMYSSSPVVDPHRSGYGSTVGGKLRALRKSGRRNPYERPAGGRHASAGPQAAVLISNGSVTAAQALAEKNPGTWLRTGLTRMITTSATYLYYSVLGRPLPAPVQVSNNDAQPAGVEEQVSSPSAEANDTEAVSRSEFENEEQAEVQEPRNNTLSDIERLIEKKPISREECERLSALLQARVVSNGTDRKKQGGQVDREIRASHQENEPAVGVQTEAQRWRQDLQKWREERENGVRTLTVYENGTPSSATPTAAVESLDGLSSSPVDVAIAFMGRRVTRQPGTVSPAEPLNQRDENILSSGPPFSRISQATLPKWVPPDFSDEEQFRTPVPPSAQTRSRTQGFLRSPYSRPQRFQPPRERALDGSFGSPLSTRWTPIRTPVTGGREMLKRRSTVLDDSYASGGPIRRTRQKAFITPPPISPRASAFPLTSMSGSALMTLPSSQGEKFVGHSANQKLTGSSIGQDKASLNVSGMSYVPAQSSETARKILETLEKMTPSPKGKSFEEELSYVRGRPPTALTESMLNEQARKSMTVVDFPLPSGDSREPGPSGRILNYDSPSIGLLESGAKTSELAAKPKSKGKSTLYVPENGPGGLQPLQERKTTAAGLLEEVSARTKDSEAVLASFSEKGQGFRMNAVFEESGSDDEGRHNTTASGSGSTVVTTPSLTASGAKLASTSGKIATPPVSIFSAAAKPTTDTNLAAEPSGSSLAVDVLKTMPSTQMASTFSFPTRVSQDGPPTPKAMSPASTSPKNAPATTPFMSYPANTLGASGLAASNSRAEQTSFPAKVHPPTDSNTEFTFGSSNTASITFPQSFSKPQATTDSKEPNLFIQRAPLFGASSSATLPSTSTSAGATTSTSAPATSAASGLKFDTSSSSPSGLTTSIKEGSTPSPFGPSAGSFLFSAGASATTSSFGTALSSSLFGSNSGSGTSTSFAGGSISFGHSTPSPETPALTPTAIVTPAAQVISKTNGTVALDADRPQKRSAFAFEQDSSKGPSSATTSSHSFTTFGTSIVSSAATTTIPATFGAASSSAPSSQNLFGSTFRQLPRESESSAASLSATVSHVPASTVASTPSPFLFGIPPSSAAASTPVLSAPEFSSTPFPSFTGAVFASSASGSTFGITPASPVSFGAASSTPVFGSTSSKPAFGGFTTEAVSQSPSVPVFGSGFSATPAQSPSSTPTFSFGGSSSPAFSFAANSTSSSSGSAFAFGSTSSFPFGANKSAPPSPAPSVFGLSSSAPAFGSTTNGSMASDVVVSDHSNMEDSMAEEPPQIAASLPAQQTSPFGGQSTATSSSFVFGAPTAAPSGAAPPLFGFPSQPSPGGFVANPFAAAAATQPPAGPLNFAGGAFNLGASGGDGRSTRKFIKAKRTGAKRGK